MVLGHVRVLVGVILLSLMATPTVYGEDLAFFYKLALEQDPQLQGALFKQVAVGETLKQAKGRFAPSLSLEGEYTKTDQKIAKTDNPVYSQGQSKFDTKSYSAQLTQPVFHRESFVGLSQARSTVKKTDYELELAKQDLMVRIVDLYLGVLAAKDNLAFVNAEKSSLDRHLELAQMRHKAGLVPLTELNDAEARLAAVQADKVEAEKILDSAMQALMEVIGKSTHQPNPMRETIVFESPLPDEVEKWLEEGMKKNLALMIKQMEAKEAQLEIDRQKAGHYPFADLYLRWNKKDTDGSLFGGGSVVDTTDIGLKLSIPIFSGGITNSKVREAHALYQKLLQEINRQERLVNRQIREFFFGVKSSISKIAALKKSVESQSLVLQAKEQGFKSGLYSTIAVLDAARDLYFYKKNYSRARYDYVLNHIKLKQAAGVFAVADLEKINAWIMN